MINALFVLVVFLLQLNKSDIHVQWPFNTKDTIMFDDSTMEITISREYLELEPIGLIFVLFFGVILFIQFIAMLIHRFATMSQILANTELDLSINCGSKTAAQNVSKEDSKKYEALKELNGIKSVEIAKELQRPPAQWDDENLSEEQQKIDRKDTIGRIVFQHKVKKNWYNLEQNFKRKYFSEEDIDLRRCTVKRQTIMLLNDRRKEKTEERRIRKSQLMVNRGRAPSTNFVPVVTTRHDYTSHNKVDQWVQNLNSAPPTPPATHARDFSYTNRAFEVTDPQEEIEMTETTPSTPRRRGSRVQWAD